MPKATPAEKISTISGSAITHASLRRPSAFQLSVIFACSVLNSEKLRLSVISKPPEPYSQFGRNRTARPPRERARLFNQYRVQQSHDTRLANPRTDLAVGGDFY